MDIHEYLQKNNNEYLTTYFNRKFK